MYRALASIERAWTSVLMIRASGSAGVMPCVCEAEGAQWRAHRGRPPAHQTPVGGRLTIGGRAGGRAGLPYVCHVRATSLGQRAYGSYGMSWTGLCSRCRSAGIPRLTCGFNFLSTGPGPIQYKAEYTVIRFGRSARYRRGALRRAAGPAKLISYPHPGRAVSDTSTQFKIRWWDSVRI